MVLASVLAACGTTHQTFSHYVDTSALTNATDVQPFSGGTVVWWRSAGGVYELRDGHIRLALNPKSVGFADGFIGMDAWNSGSVWVAGDLKGSPSGFGLCMTTNAAASWDCISGRSEIGTLFGASVIPIGLKPAFVLVTGQPENATYAPEQLFYEDNSRLQSVWHRSSADLSEVQFFDRMHGVSLGFSSSNRPDVEFTSDGGRAWHQAVLPSVCQRGAVMCQVNSLYLAGNAGRAFVLGSTPQSYALWESHDFGATWRISMTIPNGYGYLMYAGTHAYSLGFKPLRLLRVSLPTHAVSVVAPRGLSRKTIAGVDAFAVAGNRSMIMLYHDAVFLRSTDGGVHWRVVPDRRTRP